MFRIYADGTSIHEPLDRDRVTFSPKLKLEFGKAGSFQFTVCKSHPMYESFEQLKTVITVYMDDEELFKGRVLSITRDFYNRKTIYCEGDLAYLVDSIQMTQKFVGTTHELFQKIINRHNNLVEAEKQFEIGNITIEDRDVYIAGISYEEPEVDDAES